MKKGLALNFAILGMMYLSSSYIYADEPTVKFETVVVTGDSKSGVCEVTLEREFKGASKKHYDIYKKIIEKRVIKLLRKEGLALSFLREVSCVATTCMHQTRNLAKPV